MTDLACVWLVPVDLPPEAAARCREVLDASERARAAAFLSPRDRQRFEAAHGALRLLAGGELGARPAALSWTSGPHGKPQLAPPWSAVHTSLSHSGDWIAAAVSVSRPAGVDVQHLVPGLDAVGLAGRFFPPAEAAAVAAGGDEHVRAERFARLWARKEAVVKAAGGRLWPNLGITVRGRSIVSLAEPAGRYRVADVPAPAGFRAAVALEGDARFDVSAAVWRGDGSARCRRA